MCPRTLGPVDIWNRFSSDITAFERLFDSVVALRPASKHSSSPMSWRQSSELIEGIFMKFYVRWEDYQESVFLAYLMGKPRSNGRVVRAHFVPRDTKHARQVYLDRRGFSDWTAPEVVLERSDLLLHNGGPFRRALASRTSELQELKTLRNAIAHNSGPARKSFEKLVRNRLTYMPPNTTPGTFLTSILPRTTKSLWEEYVELIRLVGEALTD